MLFKTAFIAHTPDADPEKHRKDLETGMYQLYVRLVKGQEQAIEVVDKLVKEKNIHSIILCPGFTNQEVAEVSQVAGPEVGVSVARGDGPSSKIANKAMKKAGWFE